MRQYVRHDSRVTNALKARWIRFWMRYAGLSGFGRLATHLATWFAPPHKSSTFLAGMNPLGYIAPSAVIHHSDLWFGANVFVGDRVVLYQNAGGGRMEIGSRVRIYRDAALETGDGGILIVGEATYIHPRCQINAYKASIHIGRGVDMAPNCAVYSYDHSFEKGMSIHTQPLKSKGNIVIGDHSWLGVGVIVLSGVRIGRGAVIGAGSVVTQDIPDEAVAVGVPARIIKTRGGLNDRRIQDFIEADSVNSSSS